jgi:hypothetical protein
VRPQRNPQVECGCADADEYLAAAGIERAQLAAAVDENVDGVAVRPEQPGLGVVHRRRGCRGE